MFSAIVREFLLPLLVFLLLRSLPRSVFAAMRPPTRPLCHQEEEIPGFSRGGSRAFPPRLNVLSHRSRVPAAPAGLSTPGPPAARRLRSHAFPFPAPRPTPTQTG